MTICYVDSPVGRLAVESDHDAVTGVRWASPGERTRDKAKSPVLKEAARQLDRYFARKLERFDLPLAQRGTDFQKRVWAAMRDIPYGQTATYGGMAMALGSGPRPVGMACARNPSPSSCPATACWAAAARKAASRAARACRPSGNCWHWKASCFFSATTSSSSCLLSPARGRGWVRGLRTIFDAPSPNLSP